MPGYIEMKDAPPVVRDDEEAVQYAECERRHGEEIRGSNRFAMVTQERRPSLGRLGVPRCRPHPAQHGTFRDVETEHFQLTMDAWRTPGRVLCDHAKDEVA